MQRARGALIMPAPEQRPISNPMMFSSVWSEMNLREALSQTLSPILAYPRCELASDPTR